MGGWGGGGTSRGSAHCRLDRSDSSAFWPLRQGGRGGRSPWPYRDRRRKEMRVVSGDVLVLSQVNTARARCRWLRSQSRANDFAKCICFAELMFMRVIFLCLGKSGVFFLQSSLFRVFPLTCFLWHKRILAFEFSIELYQLLIDRKGGVIMI